MRIYLLVFLILGSSLANAQASDSATFSVTESQLSSCLEKSHFAAMTLEMRLRGETLSEATQMVSKMATSPDRKAAYMEITREMHRVDLPQGAPSGRPFVNGIFNHQVTRCIADQ